MEEHDNLIYKYRAGTLRDIEFVENNFLWIPYAQYLNDPADPFYYLSPATEYYVDYLDEMFLNTFNSYLVASFSQRPNVKQLWNYYTDGLRGFCVAYDKNEIYKELSHVFRITNVRRKKIEYVESKTCIDNIITNFLQENGDELEQIDDLFFKKGKSWAGEEEYRFLVRPNTKTDNKEGFILKRIHPKRIYIGCRMHFEHKKRLFVYAQNNGVELFLAQNGYRFSEDEITIRPITNEQELGLV